MSAFIAHTRWDVKTEGAPIDKLAAVSQHPRGDSIYDPISSACRLYLDELIKVILPACGDHVLRDVMQDDTYVDNCHLLLFVSFLLISSSPNL